MNFKRVKIAPGDDPEAAIFRCLSRVAVPSEIHYDAQLDEYWVWYLELSPDWDIT